MKYTAWTILAVALIALCSLALTGCGAKGSQVPDNDDPAAIARQKRLQQAAKPHASPSSTQSNQLPEDGPPSAKKLKERLSLEMNRNDIIRKNSKEYGAALDLNDGELRYLYLHDYHVRFEPFDDPDSKRGRRFWLVPTEMVATPGGAEGKMDVILILHEGQVNNIFPEANFVATGKWQRDLVEALKIEKYDYFDKAAFEKLTGLPAAKK